MGCGYPLGNLHYSQHDPSCPLKTSQVLQVLSPLACLCPSDTHPWDCPYTNKPCQRKRNTQ